MYGPHKGRPFGLTMAHHARCTPPRKTNYWSGGGPTMRNLDLRSTVEHSFPKCYKAVLKALLVKRVGSTCYNPLLMELRERLWLHSQYSRISNRGHSSVLPCSVLNCNSEGLTLSACSMLTNVLQVAVLPSIPGQKHTPHHHHLQSTSNLGLALHLALPRARSRCHLRNKTPLVSPYSDLADGRNGWKCTEQMATLLQLHSLH